MPCLSLSVGRDDATKVEVAMRVLAAVIFSCCVVSSAAFSAGARHRLSKAHVLHASVAQLPEGVVKSVAKEGNGFLVRDGDVATVKYSCSVPNALPFSKAERQQVVGLLNNEFPSGEPP